MSSFVMSNLHEDIHTAKKVKLVFTKRYLVFCCTQMYWFIKHLNKYVAMKKNQQTSNGSCIALVVFQ